MKLPDFFYKLEYSTITLILTAMNALLIFLLVFLSLFFAMRKLLIYTNDTVGNNSPFVVSRTYKPTFSITRMSDVFFVIMALIGGAMSIKLIGALLGSGNIITIGLGIGAIVLGPLLLYIGLVQGVILYNHWQNDQKFMITLSPEDRKVILENQQIEFTSNELVSVQLVTNSHHRLLKSYYHYTLSNGYSFSISMLHPVAEILNEFLGVKKLTVYETYFPLIESGLRWPFLEHIYSIYARIFKRNYVEHEVEL